MRNNSKTRRCQKCGRHKYKKYFYRSGTTLSSWCRSCFKKRSKQQSEDGYFIKHRPAKAARKYAPLQRRTGILLQYARKRALRFGREFRLTFGGVVALMETFCNTHHYSFEKGNPFLPSLDRVDSAKGYIPSNIKVVWYIENLAKNYFTEAEVLEFCERKLASVERKAA